MVTAALLPYCAVQLPAAAKTRLPVRTVVFHDTYSCCCACHITGGLMSSDRVQAFLVFQASAILSSSIAGIMHAVRLCKLYSNESQIELLSYAGESPCMHCQDVLDKRCPLGCTVLLLRNSGLLPPAQEQFQEHAAHTNIMQEMIPGKR
eukprot:7285-Heterococcus_DN1.PRE.3